MTDMDIWLRMHYESGQILMKDIRNAFRHMGYDLVPGEAPGQERAWAEVKDRYSATDSSRVAEEHWEAFREAADRLRYRPARVTEKGQEDTFEGFGEQGVDSVAPPMRAEARERVVGQTLGRLRWLSLGGTATPPVHPGDVGVDLSTVHDAHIQPGGVTYVPLGVAFAAPPGAWILLIGRSSLASKLGLAMVPGVIDNGFRGEMLAGLYPIGPTSIKLPAGTRVAQAILVPMFPTMLEQVDTLPESARGANGFGSTGGH
jgi:dUTP pyrophosphatase